MMVTNRDKFLPLTVDNEAYDNVILCPLCHSPHLHQQELTATFDESFEDGEGNRVVINRQGVLIDRIRDPFHMGRRDWLMIGFECENCSYAVSDQGKTLVKQLGLIIYQHKGSTITHWVSGHVKIYPEQPVSDPIF